MSLSGDICSANDGRQHSQQQLLVLPLISAGAPSEEVSVYHTELAASRLACLKVALCKLMNRANVMHVPETGVRTSSAE